MAKGTQTQDGTASRFIGPINNEALARFVEKIEGLQRTRKEVNASMTATYEEAKAAGFVPAILREIISERKLDDEVRQDRYALLEAYRKALGMLADTPLGEAAMQRAANVSAASEAAAARHNGKTATKPKPFAEQPITQPGETKKRSRGRPRKGVMIFDSANPNGAPAA